jgi:hypothetical protein
MDPLRTVSKETEICRGRILSVLVQDFSVLKCSEVHELEQ